MKRIMSIAIAASLLTGINILSTVSAEANPRYKGRVNNRQHRQQTRINQGVSSGQLTKRETLGIQRREAQLAQKEQRMRQSGGGLTAKEHAQLEHSQDNLSKSIYTQKHDSQARGSGGGN